MSARRRCARAALAAWLVLLPPLGACTSAPHEHAPGTADCPVCRHTGDLACLCVPVEADTPHCECDGKVYYFCSEECRADFLAHPERYTD